MMQSDAYGKVQGVREVFLNGNGIPHHAKYLVTQSIWAVGVNPGTMPYAPDCIM